MNPIDRYRAISNGVRTQTSMLNEKIIAENVRSDDVIIVGPVKSGTTWMQQILHQIRTKGDEIYKDIFEVVPHFTDRKVGDFFDPKADQIANPRIFKSHLTYEMLPQSQNVRYVVLLRDPYDAELSFMKFAWRFYGFDRDMTPEEHAEITNIRPAPDYATLVASWWRQRKNTRVLLMPYDELKQDLPGCIQKLSEFIYEKRLEEKDLSKILYLCSFEYMSKNSDKFKGEKMVKYLSTNANIQYQPVIAGMVRADGGQLGQGKALLAESVRRHIDKRWKEVIEKEYGIKNYEELYEFWKSKNY